MTLTLAGENLLSNEQPTYDTRSEDLNAPVRIVLIEDFEDARTMLEVLLQLQKFEVTSVANGIDGVDSILQTKPNVALVDIGLPDIDGCEVARRVRREMASDQVRLIALTGHGQQRDIVRCKAAGFDQHLTKPIDQTKLFQVLRSAHETAS